MTKYKQSLNIDIYPVSECDYSNIPEEYLLDYYVLHNEVKNKYYLINPTIKFFLDKFLTPITLEQVVSDIQNDFTTNSQEIEKVCKDFFTFLKSKKILVTEDTEKILVENSDLFHSGDEVNGFIITELISSRKDVELYKARIQNQTEDYVLKVLNKNKMKNEQHFIHETGWLHREYEFLQYMHHVPQICKAYSFVKNDQYAFIQMEYIHGNSLTRFLDNNTSFTIQDLIILIEKIISPFSELHKKNLIHGDIHSANVMINEMQEIKIIDLGFSSIAEIEKDEVLKSGGVTYYMPPERINQTSLHKYNKRAADLRSDVYQLGILMYLVLYNKLPVDGFIWEQLAENIQQGNIEYPSLSYTGYEVPLPFINIIKKCLCIQPEKRYENADMLLSEIKSKMVTKSTVETS